MTYTVITGPPCAGKSTYAREHAAPTDILIDLDDLAAVLTTTSERYEVPDNARKVAMDMRMTAITSAARQQADVWVIDTEPSPERQAVYRMAQARYVQLDPGMDVCLARAADRPAEWEHYIQRWYATHPHK